MAMGLLYSSWLLYLYDVNMIHMLPNEGSLRFPDVTYEGASSFPLREEVLVSITLSLDLSRARVPNVN